MAEEVFGVFIKDFILLDDFGSGWPAAEETKPIPGMIVPQAVIPSRCMFR